MAPYQHRKRSSNIRGFQPSTMSPSHHPYQILRAITQHHHMCFMASLDSQIFGFADLSRWCREVKMAGWHALRSRSSPSSGRIKLCWYPYCCFGWFAFLLTSVSSPPPEYKRCGSYHMNNQIIDSKKSCLHQGHMQYAEVFVDVHVDLHLWELLASFHDCVNLRQKLESKYIAE